MQLRSGRSLESNTSKKAESQHGMTMRRDSRNYEEFNERKKYQANQRVIENSIYSSEKEIIAYQKKHVYMTIRHLLAAVDYQKKNNYSLYEIIDTCGELFKFLNDSMPFIVEHKAMCERLAEAIVTSGINISREIYKIDKTRAQTEKVNSCRRYIGNVIDMIQHHVLKRK